MKVILNEILEDLTLFDSIYSLLADFSVILVRKLAKHIWDTFNLPQISFRFQHILRDSNSQRLLLKID
jgi:hypothetical protein